MSGDPFDFPGSAWPKVTPPPPPRPQWVATFERDGVTISCAQLAPGSPFFLGCSQCDFSASSKFGPLDQQQLAIVGGALQHMKSHGIVFV